MAGSESAARIRRVQEGRRSIHRRLQRKHHRIGGPRKQFQGYQRGNARNRFVYPAYSWRQIMGIRPEGNPTNCTTTKGNQTRLWQSLGSTHLASRGGEEGGGGEEA